jgi:ribose-phosphate pyrophosphokinase
VNPTGPLALFGLGASRDYAERVAWHLGLPLCPHEERTFEDGEHKFRPLESVRGRDVFVVHSLYGEQDASANDKFCQMLFFVGALRDASAGRVTAVVPYLCYARKDRKTKPRDPVTSRYVAQLFEAVGIDRVVTVDVHNLAAFQNAFRKPTEHLEAASLFVDHLAGLLAGREPVVVSPDVGGVKRAERFRELLVHRLGCSVPVAFLEKYRSAGVVSGSAVVGDVSGRTALILDDLVSSGTTMARAGRACRAQGSAGVVALATHGVFNQAANAVVADPVFDAFVVTDTVSANRLDPAVQTRVTVVDSTRLVAEAIDRIHTDGSLVDLLEPRPS